MMAGTGVSTGGAGMLRTRRRDVSVKPNRKLDRKSSRGMIYENEELRLRTIHINAEVEQGQNDIKKLRRENEQLRREIWSLRDEYDKLEEIVKRQKNQEESEDYEDRSEEDDALRSDYSCEDDEEVDEGEEEVEDSKANGDGNQSERLENAENQKISSEKMNSSVGGTGGLHRLHVDFDDLSVVDEEEEVKKEKERKEAASSDEPQPSKEGSRNLTRVIGPRQLHENIPFYPGAYEPSGAYSGTSYYQNCPFEFPGRVDPMDPSGMLTTPCPRMYADPLIPLASLEPPVLSQVPDQILPQIHMPPVGWQNNVLQAEKQLSSYPASTTSPGIPILGTSEPRVHLESQGAEFRHFGSPLSPSTVYSNFSSTPQRKTASRQPLKLPAANHFEDFTEVSSGKPVVRNGWTKPVNSTGESGEDQRGEAIASRKPEDGGQEASTLSVSDRPKHFFAPLPSKMKRQVEQEESPTTSTSYFGTGNSSSSGKTGSTVISRSNPFVGLKGSADIYVNGAVPFDDGARRDRDEQKTYLSFDNLLIDDGKSCGNSPLTKSMSCQDLSSEAQNISVSEQLKASHNEGKPQLLTKSDNTLDNITSGPSGRPYKTHLNVTLKVPRIEGSPNPETPEIPKLPSIDYRLCKNPFLQKFEPTVPMYGDRPSPVTRPLSIQVNDNAPCHYPSPPALSTFNRDFHLTEKYHTGLRGQPSQNRLLIPSDQLTDGKILSPMNKQDIQVTSFERPSPHALLPTAIPYDLETLRRITANRYLQAQNLYQNVPFVPRGPGHVCPQTSAGAVRMYYDNVATKVPAQTQTSIDGDYRQEDDHPAGNRDEEIASATNSPGAQRRKRPMKKEKSSAMKDPKPLSPAAQRRLRKQSSLTSTEAPDSPGKSARHRPRKLSVTTTTTSEAQEDKNESRSSSSGQDSPRKDQQNRRVSIYFNAKKRPSLASVKTMRSGSLDASKDKYLDGTTTATNSERERTNSVSSREGVKARKASTSSGNVPWCACWGNGCI